MAQPFLLIYTLAADGVQEPASKYFLNGPLSTQASKQATAEVIAAGHAQLLHTSHQLNRWEYVGADGSQDGEGNLAESGIWADQAAPFYLCLFFELISDGPGRPSTKFIHGFSEASMAPTGLPAAMAASVEAWASALVDATVTDSDGVPVTAVQFSHFGRRRRIRKRTV